MDGTEQDKTTAAEAEETTQADTTADAASGDAGAGDKAATETPAQDAAEKKDAAAAETPAKADQAAAVADKADKPAEDKADKPADDKEKPTDDKAKDAEHAKQLEKLKEQVTKAETRLRSSMAENAAYQAGIRPDRVDKAVRLAEISDIDLSAEDAQAKFEAALQAVADDMPELTAPPAGTGSLGAFGRKKEGKPDPFVQGTKSA